MSAVFMCSCFHPSCGLLHSTFVLLIVFVHCVLSRAEYINLHATNNSAAGPIYTICSPSQPKCAPYNAEFAVAGSLPSFHEVPSAKQRSHHKLFLAFASHGYVIFAKEPNTLGCGGSCIEFAFLLLDLEKRTPAIPGLNSSQYSTLALQESFGFLEFTDAEWQLKKTIHRAQMMRQIYPSRDHGNVFYQKNWEPSWSCSFVQRVGAPGDGGKWVCDAYKIAGQQECLVISIGSNNDFSFEESILQLNPLCAIHTFDHTVGSNPSRKPPAVHFHPIGLGTSNHGKIRTMASILTKLGISGSGRMVDILKIDCEGCEFLVYPELVGRPIRQILMEIHYSKAI